VGVVNQLTYFSLPSPLRASPVYFVAGGFATLLELRSDKNMNYKNKNLLLCVASLVAIGCFRSTAADFSVTTPGAQFAFAMVNSSGQSLGNSPTLTLVRGRTYTFAVATTAGFHPFRINSTGATPNHTDTGTITFVVPTNAANYTYDCFVHGASMQGQILTVPPPAPPVPSIVSWTLSSNIVLRTAPGTSSFSVIPEYRTNLNFTNWIPLTIQSNRFLNGTNETFCGRPPAQNLFIRVKVQ
jgi:hypothetical protein